MVDDDNDFRQVMRDILEEVGYRVDDADGGSAALERLRASPEQLVVLLDVLMPGMDGVQVLEAIAAAADTTPTAPATQTAHAARNPEQQRLATPHAYILVSTTKDPPASISLLSTQLHVKYLVKPFDIDVLLQMVKAAADHLSAESASQASQRTAHSSARMG